MTHTTPDPLRETDVPHMHPMEVMARNFRAKQRAALAAPQPAPDPLREAAQAVLDCWDSRNWKAAPTADYMRRLRAALAATPQPAPAPAADERDEIERIICDAFTCDLRGRGDEDGAFWQTAADALLAAGYRKADACADAPETLAWAVVGEDGSLIGINYDRETAQHLCNPGESVVRVAIRIVEDEA